MRNWPKKTEPELGLEKKLAWASRKFFCCFGEKFLAKNFSRLRLVMPRKMKWQLAQKTIYLIVKFSTFLFPRL